MKGEERREKASSRILFAGTGAAKAEGATARTRQRKRVEVCIMRECERKNYDAEDRGAGGCNIHIPMPKAGFARLLYTLIAKQARLDLL